VNRSDMASKAEVWGKAHTQVEHSGQIFLDYIQEVDYIPAQAYNG
jgi:hypothetical protein